MPQLKDSAISLRAPEPDDVDSLYLWENDRNSQGGCCAAPVSRLQVWNYVQNYDADPLRAGELRLIITENAGGASIGTIDLTEIDIHNRRAAVGIYITPEHRRRGMASRALNLLYSYALGELGLHQLWACVAADNRPSLALFTSCGFRSAGRLRSWLLTPHGWQDVLILQRLHSL